MTPGSHDVYWGSHGCHLPKGHLGPYICDSCYDPDDTDGYVGGFPYYGPMTQFYGDDADEVQAWFDVAVRFLP